MSYTVAVIFAAALLVASFSNANSAEFITAKSPEESERLTPLVGFRGINWGEDPANVQGFMLEKTDKYGSYFSRGNENLRLDSAVLSSVTYKVYSQKLYAVTLEFINEENFELVMKKFFEEFGESWTSNKSTFEKELSWRLHEKSAKDSGPTATALIRFNSKTQQGFATFVYKEFAPPLSLYFTADMHQKSVEAPAIIFNNCESRQDIKRRVFHSMYENKNLADLAYYRIVSNTAEPQFDQLRAAAGKESVDVGSNKKGGDLGYIKTGMFDEGFELSVFNLPLNTLSRPIQSSYGWHLAWVTDAIDGKTNTHCKSYLRQ